MRKTAFLAHLPTRLFGYAILLRLGLFIFSVWQEVTRWPDGQLRFTDVDYDVFTDAAKAMIRGRNIYEARPTYRYSPLIALLLCPGHFIVTKFCLSTPFHTAAYAFGKVVFIGADIFCAILQSNIILLINSNKAKSAQMIPWLVGAFWLFNPVTATVSVRGNAESVVGTCVLACLWTLLLDEVLLAGVLYGLCIHLKLYPVIYAPVIYLQLCDPLYSTRIRLLPTRRHWIFGFATLATLVGLTWVGYTLYGWAFLHHAYFYHFMRMDLWHNFAPHFYPIYLFEGALALNETAYDPSLFPYNYFPTWLLKAFFRPAALQNLYAVFKVLIMLPSVLLVASLSFLLKRTPSFAWFAITFGFVTFNKVCTSQYFLWWLVLLPPALAHIHTPSKPHEAANGLLDWVAHATCLTTVGLRRTALLAGLWFVGQACWLAVAYLHEMGGGGLWVRGLWLALWVASAIFFIINIVILKCLMRWLPSGSSSPPSDKRSQPLMTLVASPHFEMREEDHEGIIRRRYVEPNEAAK